MPVNGMIQWAALGMFFKAVSWAIAFLYLAKSDSRLFFINELLANIYALVLNVVGYKLWGLNGLGLSFLITYILYLIQVFIFCRKKYAFNFDKSFVKIFTVQLSSAIACFCTIKFIHVPYQYIAGSGFIILSSVYSLRELNKRLDFKAIVLKLKKTKR
jgi:O-antigen/teichoic acid export membrane protein